MELSYLEELNPNREGNGIGLLNVHYMELQAAIGNDFVSEYSSRSVKCINKILDMIFKRNQMNKCIYWEACRLHAQTGNLLPEKNVKLSTNR
jgi:hypothetical protein